MKHRFLLDENILHFAINGVNEHEQADDTSTTLVKQIGLNCHSIVVNKFLLARYWRQMTNIQREVRRSRALEPVAFINQLLMNAQKWTLQLEELPALPETAVIPAEDVEIVRFALLAKARVITGDAELRRAINACPALELRALTPEEALPYAADS